MVWCADGLGRTAVRQDLDHTPRAGRCRRLQGEDPAVDAFFLVEGREGLDHPWCTRVGKLACRSCAGVLNRGDGAPTRALLVAPLATLAAVALELLRPRALVLALHTLVLALVLAVTLLLAVALVLAPLASLRLALAVQGVDLHGLAAVAPLATGGDKGLDRGSHQRVAGQGLGVDQKVCLDLGRRSLRDDCSLDDVWQDLPAQLLELVDLLFPLDDAVHQLRLVAHEVHL